MKNASATLKSALKSGTTLKVYPELIAEWNLNRYLSTSSVSNVVDSQMDPLVQDCFPIESIVEPLRPESAGILKVWTDSGIKTSLPFATPEPGTVEFARGIRSFTADPDAIYKYWVSDNESDGSGNITNVRPQIVYSTSAWCNKISVCFEKNISYPIEYTVEYTVNGTTWLVAATNVAVPSIGRVTIYRGENGLWSTSVNRSNPIKIRGVRVNITKINKASERVAIIEVSPRLESDLSDVLISSSSEFTMSENSIIAPIGVASSNSASVSLSNVDGRFNNNNPSSIYYKLIDKNVKMSLNYVFDLTEFGGSSESVRQFTMFADEWSGQDEESMNVSLRDSSKFFQEIKPQAVYWPDCSLPAIVANICDSIGFSSWSYDNFNSQVADRIPHFWLNGEDTAWNALSDLAEPTQTAIFFDEYGFLRIRTRESAYDDSADPVWTLTSEDISGQLSNIVSLENTGEYDANKVNVKYLGTSISEDNRKNPAMEIVWEPSDTLVLRSSNLGTEISDSSFSFKINPTDAVTWNYSGFVLIDGEVIEYDAKGYSYTNKAGLVVHKYIKSNEEKDNVDKVLSSTNLAFTNKFSGYFRIKNRALWGTTKDIHPVSEYGYARQIDDIKANSITTWTGGSTQDTLNSVAKVRTTAKFGWNKRYINKINAGGSGTYKYFGTRFKFSSSGYTLGAAGLGFNIGTGNTGYYVELIRTAAISSSSRKTGNEIQLFVIPSAGTYKKIGPNNGAGIATQIVADRWYDLDVRFKVETNGSHTIQVLLNGKSMFVTNITTNKQTPTSTIAYYTRGFTYADFEYLYAVGSNIDEENFDGTDPWDNIRGGFASRRWHQKFAFRTVRNPYTRKSVKILYSSPESRFFDDFGPIVHEIRKFNVKFEKYPNVHSNLYYSNTSQIACLDYNSNPFGAEFTLVNITRENAVLNGEDSLTFGIDNPVDQKMMIYGRLVTQDDEQEVVVKDENGIRIRGLVETDFSSKFIQSEAAAKSIGDWVTKHWGIGNQELSVEIFGNPLITIGDSVLVNYPTRHLNTSQGAWFVTGVTDSFSNGISTVVTLRKVKV